MKEAVPGIVLVVALLAAAYLFMVGTAPKTPQDPQLSLYASGTYGISFAYPDGYLLTEEERDGGATITLIQEADAVPVVAGGEGPTAITIVLTPLEERETLHTWRTTPASNMQISDGAYASTSVSGAEAITYRWSGLYEGETTAFVHKGTLIAISVTYFSPTDPIRAAYLTVLESFTLR